MHTLELTAASRYIAGITLLTIVGIEFGGWFMTRIVRGQVPRTDFQKAFARAGHVVVSNSRNHRMDRDVPLLVPEINPDHLKLIPGQVVQIATEDPQALASYDNFVAAVFGPQ